MYLFLALLGLCCGVGFSLAVLLIAVTSLVEHGRASFISWDT